MSSHDRRLRHEGSARRAIVRQPLVTPRAARESVRATFGGVLLLGFSVLLFVLVTLALGACQVAEERTEFASASVEFGAPPPTEVVEVADTLHGDVVADPYRWLEDQEAPKTRAWIDAQNEYTDGIFTQLPGRAQLTELATKLIKIDRMGAPQEKGGRYFFGMTRADDELPIYYFRDGYTGEDQVLLDPHGMSEDNTTTVGLRDVSDDGKTVVYQVREGGVDEAEIRVMEVDTRTDLPDVLPTGRYGSVTLTPDASGFYYVRYGNVEPRVLYHAIGTDPSEDVEVFGEGYTRRDIPVVSLSDDGNWMLVHVIQGSSGPTELFLKDLANDGPFVTVISDGKSRTRGSFAGDRLLLTTDLDAPNKRVMVADLADPSVENWTELVPERADVVINRAGGAGGHYFVSYMKDVQPRVTQLDTDGNVVREIDFDVIGSVWGGGGEWDKNEAFFSFTSFHVPTTTYRYDIETGEMDVWFQQEVPIDTEAIDVKQVRYTSKDGTEVPMFIVHRKGLDLDGENPTYLTGYGGFNASRTPGFSAAAAAWVDMGGVYAVPNLRGGGEFGEEWHKAGMLGNKQNVFDDFIAAAEYLISEGYTKPERLAIRGGSNGGLLVGAAMTQRPELFGAVVCTYPLLDMVRYHQFMVARFWVPEYGSSDDPEQFEYLKAYSPYHNVVDGTDYPATLFITGDGDTRVAPLHARKMAALVQAAHAGEDPILLRYHVKAGHSGGQPVSEQIEQLVDTFSFLMWRLGGAS